MDQQSVDRVERNLFSSAQSAVHTSALSRLSVTWPGIMLKCIPGLKKAVM